MNYRSTFFCLVFLVAACGGRLPSSAGNGDNDRLLPSGRTCSEGSECQSGYCIDLAAGKACAQLCAGECTGGLVCKNANGREPAPLSICVPPSAKLCQSCDSDADCGGYGDLCMQLDSGKFCASDCSETRECPIGFGCENVIDDDGKDLPSQCIPEARTCTCNAQNDGAERPCEKSTPGVGSCLGTEVCVADIGWSGCDARTPLPELCDEVDNDCDGATDENLAGAPLSRPCGFGPEPRSAECSGLEECHGGIYAECSLDAPPELETACDGKDDDCDGQVDEDVLHTADACNACGDVCPPGPGFEASTARACVSNGSSYACSDIGCRAPYYDVDGDEANGCELADDSTQIDGAVVLNDTAAQAFPVGSGTVGVCDGNEVHRCALRLPSDERTHVPVAPPDPQTDYFRVYISDSAWCVVETHVCIYTPRALPSDVDADVELCVSPSKGSLDGNPSFPADRCKTIDLATNNWAELYLDNDGDEYFYVRVRSKGAPYHGNYAISVYDDGDSNCRLGISGDPCAGTY